MKLQYTWCKEPAHWKRPWCRERLKARGGGGSRRQDGLVTSPTLWTEIWTNSRRLSRTEEPGVLQSIGSQRGSHDLATDRWQQNLHGYRTLRKMKYLIQSGVLHSHLLSTSCSISSEMEGQLYLVRFEEYDYYLKTLSNSAFQLHIKQVISPYFLSSVTNHTSYLYLILYETSILCVRY